MNFMQPRASYRPLGRQPFRPGQWQGFRGVSKNTTYIQNNFFGGSYNSGMNYNSCFSYGNYNNYGNYGCNCGGGSNKFLNWMLGIGVGTTLLGGILNLFGIGTKNNPQQITGEDPNAKVRRHEDPQRDKVEEETDVDDVDEANDSDEADDVDSADEAEAAKRKKEEAQTDILTVKKEEVKTSTNYKVNYGDTWANVITAKYKDENGKPISFADAKELWTKLKSECGVSKNADGMPSNIELPNEFKNYKLDINGKVNANNVFNNNNYKGYDGKGFTAKTTTTFTARGTVNGKPIGTVSGSQSEVTAQLKEKGFSEKDINEAIKSGEVKITRQSEE